MLLLEKTSGEEGNLFVDALTRSIKKAYKSIVILQGIVYILFFNLSRKQGRKEYEYEEENIKCIT